MIETADDDRFLDWKRFDIDVIVEALLICGVRLFAAAAAGDAE